MVFDVTVIRSWYTETSHQGSHASASSEIEYRCVLGHGANTPVADVFWFLYGEWDRRKKSNYTVCLWVLSSIANSTGNCIKPVSGSAKTQRDMSVALRLLLPRSDSSTYSELWLCLTTTVERKAIGSTADNRSAMYTSKETKKFDCEIRRYGPMRVLMCIRSSSRQASLVYSPLFKFHARSKPSLEQVTIRGPSGRVHSLA
jgi:hypothetical protein